MVKLEDGISVHQLSAARPTPNLPPTGYLDAGHGHQQDFQEVNLKNEADTWLNSKDALMATDANGNNGVAAAGGAPGGSLFVIRRPALLEGRGIYIFSVQVCGISLQLFAPHFHTFSDPLLARFYCLLLILSLSSLSLAFLRFCFTRFFPLFFYKQTHLTTVSVEAKPQRRPRPSQLQLTTGAA